MEYWIQQPKKLNLFSKFSVKIFTYFENPVKRIKISLL